MSITIDNPTAEAIYAALQEVPAGEITRLRQMLNEAFTESADEEASAWYQASETSAALFFEDEEKS